MTRAGSASAKSRARTSAESLDCRFMDDLLLPSSTGTSPGDTNEEQGVRVGLRPREREQNHEGLTRQVKRRAPEHVDEGRDEHRHPRPFQWHPAPDRKSTRLNSSHGYNS